MKKPPDLDGFFCGNSRTGFSRTVPIVIGNADYTEFHRLMLGCASHFSQSNPQ